MLIDIASRIFNVLTQQLTIRRTQMTVALRYIGRLGAAARRILQQKMMRPDACRMLPSLFRHGLFRFARVRRVRRRGCQHRNSNRQLRTNIQFTCLSNSPFHL